MPTRVVLADDHKIVRDGLTSMLVRATDIEIVGEAEDGAQAVELAEQLRPDVVIMDIGMSGLNGIDATRQLTDRMPDIKVIALSMHSDGRYVTEMLSAGASGYLLKDADVDELIRAIRAVAAGGRFLSASITGVVLDDYMRRVSGQDEAASAPVGGLSAREQQVLQLIAGGLSTKQVAAQLHLSAKTVETHRRQIMDKLGIYNVAGLIKFALRQGLTSLDD